MSMVNPTSVATADRVIGLRKRRDLLIQESEFQGETCWVVKDPLAMKYFRLRKPEYLVLQQLDGSSSYHQIKRVLAQAFPDFKIRLESVQQLVISLHEYGLLVSDATGQALPLRKRRTKELQQKAMGLASSLIALRLPGWDPDSFLSWLYPKCRWLFSYWFNGLVIVTCLAAALLVATNFTTFQAKLPEFQQFFAFDNLLFMGLILIVTKSIHELGHGLTCKHYGGECHEIGFMLLVLMPAMYCNTSDSWILRSRWKRMAIGAAGMYVEVFLAAICTFVWWFTYPGWIHYLALNVMFLSSVSTVVFNANPLLRYDGYYILSDFLEIPNMAQKSKTALLSVLRVGLLGMKPIDSRRLPERNLTAFAIYSVCSFVYRWLILILIFWFVAEIFEPYGLAPIGHLVIAISLVAMIIMPLFKLTKFFLYPGRFRDVKTGRMYLSLMVLAAIIGFICYFPFPHYVWGSFVIRPHAQQQVMLNQPGRLVEINKYEADELKVGQVIATLRNEELELKRIELEVQQTRLEQDLATYKTFTTIQPDASRRIAETVSSLANIRQQLSLLDQQLAALTLKAERGGKLFAPRNRKRSDAMADNLSQWSGTPLSSDNIGAWFEANTSFGVIGDADEMEALLIVNQSQVQLLQPGQKIVAQCQPFADQFLHSKIAAVSQDELQQIPPELSQTHGGPIAVAPAVQGGEEPVLKLYSASAGFDAVELRERKIELVPGMRGDVRILVGHSTIASRLHRFVSSVIRFR